MEEKTLLLKTCLCKLKPTYSSLYSYSNEIIRFSYPLKDFFYARWSANDPICRIKTSSAKTFFRFKHCSKEVKKSTQQSKLRAVPLLYLGSAVLGSLKFCDYNFFSFSR